MDIKLFDNRILAPSKCGTRYLRKVYSDIRFDLNKCNVNTITHIVVRNPYEHFESAIHTEYLNYKNTYNSTEHINHIICGAISKNGIGHWHPNTYQFLYSIFIKNPKIQIIDLINLSTFLNSEGHSIVYDKSEYDWSDLDVWESKDDILQKLKINFKSEFEIIDKKLKLEFDYYTKLLNEYRPKTIL